MKARFKQHAKTFVIVSLYFAALFVLVIANTLTFQRAAEQGRDPITIAPTTPAGASPKDGRDGIKGEKGDRGETLGPTNSQIIEAVSAYCADGRCNGQLPTSVQVSQAVQSYCASHECRGESGDNGKDGFNATEQMVAQAIAAYCAEGACRGTDGPQGAPGVGEVGPTGPQGRAPVLSCVTRTLNNTPVNYIAWRYEDEADTAYRNLYRVPTWAQAEGCVDLTGAAV